MASKNTPQPPAPPAAPALVFDWEELIPAVDAPAPVTAVGSRVNVFDLPSAIRTRAEEALAQTIRAIVQATSAGKDAKNVPPQWKVQRVGSLAQAQEFLKLMRKYAQYRPAEGDIPFHVLDMPKGQLTVRGAPCVLTGEGDSTTTRSVQESDGADARFAVRYAVKPLEVRNANSAKS